MRETLKGGAAFKYSLFAISLIIAGYVYAQNIGWEAAPNDFIKQEMHKKFN